MEQFAKNREEDLMKTICSHNQPLTIPRGIVTIKSEDGEWRLLNGFTLPMAQEIIHRHKSQCESGQWLKNDIKRRVSRVIVGNNSFIIKEFCKDHTLPCLNHGHRTWIYTQKLTGLTAEEMMQGVPFPEAAEKLGEWLLSTGPELDIFAWGGEDERILTANLEAWGLDPDWMPDAVYDARFIYDSFLGREGVSTSLTDASAELGAALDLDQHDSLNDARYLAAICRRMDLRRGMAEYAWGRMVKEMDLMMAPV